MLTDRKPESTILPPAELNARPQAGTAMTQAGKASGKGSARAGRSRKAGKAGNAVATSAALGRSAEGLLAELAQRSAPGGATCAAPADVAALLAAGLVAYEPDGALKLTDSGAAHCARRASERAGLPVDKFRAQHLGLATRTIVTGAGEQAVILDEAESPLAWLARRKGRDGKSHLKPEQLQAGERLRADFTRAQLTPRVTSNWKAAVATGPRGSAPVAFSDVVIAARQRVQHALKAVGPEFSGLLLDVCCFLKRLEDVERERAWPPRSAKIVLQFGLDGLARHYGLAAQASGRAHAAVRTWLAPDAAFALEPFMPD